MIYLDHAATTAVHPRVLEAMLPWLGTACGNASSAHRLGRQAASAISRARRTVADLLGASPREILFTSGGTESDNLALRGILSSSGGGPRHLITLPVEHPAVTQTCQHLVEGLGARIAYVPVDRFGRVNPDEIGRAITAGTRLISVMHANNEVGTIEPVEEIASIARAHRIPFHTDAVQTAGALGLRVDSLGVDLLSLSGHKFHGPKGVGVLYVRAGTPLAPMQTGGGHEQGLRAGTENVPGIVGLAEALVLACGRAESTRARLTVLRDLLIEGITGTIPNTELTGHPTERLANHASFVVRDVRSGDLIRALDEAGVAASGGSACASCVRRPSHVLTAMGYDAGLAQGALRLTLGVENSEADVRHVLRVLPEIVARLRRHGPGHPPAADRLELSHDMAGRGGASPATVNAASEPPHHGDPALREQYDPLPADGGVIASGHGPDYSRQLVYALGSLGYDFGTETRRDSYQEQAGRSLLDPGAFLTHLQAVPEAAAGAIWTLNLDGTPVYAVAPHGPFADVTYARLRELLSRQLKEEEHRVAIPGIIAGSTKLLNGRVVPVILPELRGVTAWSNTSFVRSALGEATAGQTRRTDHERDAVELSNFLDRIHDELRNRGSTPLDRAINYTGSNARRVGPLFADLARAGLKLDHITAEQAPIVRPGGDCWDVRLTFFNPARRLAESRVVACLTVDVSDIVPVAVGRLRQWHVY